MIVTVFVSAQGADGGVTEAMDLHAEGKEHLAQPHGLWHGHGRMLLLLVAVHLAAFLYWSVQST